MTKIYHDIISIFRLLSVVSLITIVNVIMGCELVKMTEYAEKQTVISSSDVIMGVFSHRKSNTILSSRSFMRVVGVMSAMRGLFCDENILSLIEHVYCCER